jgi:hypothetical protein
MWTEIFVSKPCDSEPLLTAAPGITSPFWKAMYTGPFESARSHLQDARSAYESSTKVTWVSSSHKAFFAACCEEVFAARYFKLWIFLPCAFISFVPCAAIPLCHGIWAFLTPSSKKPA